MDQAQDLDNLVGPEPVDDKVPRLTDAPRRLSTLAKQPDRVGENTSQAWHLN